MVYLILRAIILHLIICIKSIMFIQIIFFHKIASKSIFNIIIAISILISFCWGRDFFCRYFETLGKPLKNSRNAELQDRLTAFYFVLLF